MITNFLKGQYITISQNGELTKGVVPYPENKEVKNKDTFVGWEGSFGETIFRIVDSENAICEEVIKEQ
jgi:hypothetical protein